jgi:hypothetical protein
MIKKIITIKEENKVYLRWDTKFGLCKALIVNGKLQNFDFCVEGSDFE